MHTHFCKPTSAAACMVLRTDVERVEDKAGEAIGLLSLVRLY
jgi:hypothetical protein